MEQNDLDSFTLGLIKRTQERNKFLKEMNLTIEEEKPEESAPISCSPLKEKREDILSTDLHRAEPVTVVDVLIKPQFSASSLPLNERPMEDRKRVNQRFEVTEDATRPSKLERLLSSPISEKRKRLNEKRFDLITEGAKLKSTNPPTLTIAQEKPQFVEKISEKAEEKPKMVSPKPVVSKFFNRDEKPKEKENIQKLPSQPIKNYKVDDSSDPCLLSLAARRALFERKMMGATESSSSDTKIVTGASIDRNTGSSVPVPSSLNSDVQEALAAFKEIEELPSDDCVTLPLDVHRNEFSSHANVSSEPEEIIEINNVPVESNMCDEDEDEDEDSLGSNASSLLSNNDETVGGISQSTRIYPELPPLNDLVHESVNKEMNSSPEEICLLSPIKSYNTCQIESPKKPEKVTLEKPSCLPGPSSMKPVTPLRTLSMYRREQKVRTNTGKNGDEDEISQDLECEAKKRELLKKYNETKSKKIDELKIEADKYNKIIYQSFRALDLCVQTNNINERIEAEKILLVNVVKKNACVDELYRLQQEESIDLTDDPVGKMTFNKLTLLVKGDFFVSQAQCHDFYDYHFICLFTCADKVIATDALSSIDAIQEASLNFTNKIVFDNLKKDFKIRLDVYALALPKNKRNNEKKIGSMHIRLTPKSKTKVKYTHSPALKASPGNEKIKCNFKRIGFVNFSRENMGKSRFELLNFMYTSPLEDQIMANCKVECNYNIKYSSYLNFHEQTGDFPVWNRRWCVLNGPYIHYWRFSEDEGSKQPMGTINLKNCLTRTIEKASTDICMRAYSFYFVILETAEKSSVPVKHLMAADIRKERDNWLEVLNKVLELIRLWDLEAYQPIDQSELDRIMK